MVIWICVFGGFARRKAVVRGGRVAWVRLVDLAQGDTDTPGNEKSPVKGLKIDFGIGDKLQQRD